MADELTERGFAVHAVATGAEALQYIKSGADVDVLFTDVNLPGAIDGAELAVRVRAMRPELPIVYCSGRYNASNIQHQVTRSVFVAKPYDPAELCTLLGRLTEGLPARR